MKSIWIVSDTPEDLGWFSTREAAEAAVEEHPSREHHVFTITEQLLDDPLPVALTNRHKES